MTGSESRRRGGGIGRLAERFAAEKKKAVFASCLIGVMVVMWVKVLAKKQPHAAAAAGAVDGQSASYDEKSKSQSKIYFIELKKIQGRNDVLARDFFAITNWRDFVRSKGTKLADTGRVDVSVRDGDEVVVRKIVDRLELEAIEMGTVPRAFINDKLLSVGDRMKIEDGVRTYECEVIRIEEGVVFIKCGQAEITLRLSGAM